MRGLKFFPILLSFLLITISFSEIKAEEKGRASIKFEETTFDFGNIREDGGPVTHEFKFINNGSGNLVIHSAKAECGCTRPEYTEKAISPGKSGVIKVTYNPLGRPGGFTKVVTVRCNGNPAKINLKIRGSVIPAK